MKDWTDKPALVGRRFVLDGQRFLTIADHGYGCSGCAFLNWHSPCFKREAVTGDCTTGQAVFLRDTKLAKAIFAAKRMDI